jgi:hypothetical protein
MTSRLTWLALCTLAAVGACGHSEPYRTTGPVMASEGVEMSVAGERCTVNRSGEQFPTVANQDKLQLAVKVQLKNESDLPVLLVRDRFQLTQEQHPTPVTMRPLQSGIVTVLPGETKSVPLAFEQRGSLDCHHDLFLDPTDGVQMGGRKIALAPIRFTATR